jgi:hypothetical protein
LTSVGLEPATSGPDCGAQPNPCSGGFISAMLFSAAMGSGASLETYGMTASDIAAGLTVATDFPSATAIPCGSGHNATSIGDAATVLGAWSEAAAPTYPSKCPTSTYADHFQWGTCESFAYTCPIFQAYYDSTNRYFMDWWTIFYWGWWVSWGPFVGIFIATISRGRTIRQIITFGFFLPCLFSFFWFSVYGGLAIKAQRVAEVVLGQKPDYEHGTIDCGVHYSWPGVPTTQAAIDLDKLGYRMLACQPFVTQIYDIMRPYADWTPFRWIVLWVGLFFWFITSSDSGSYVDDLLGSSGLSKPPAIQRIYWAFTEGAVASILVASTPEEGDFQGVLKGLRSVSICAGLPLTVFMCLMVPATYRALKFEYGEKDILGAKKFNVQIFDFFECYNPMTKTPYSGQAGKQITTTLISLFFPAFTVYKSLSDVDSKCGSIMLALMSQLMLMIWFILQFVEIGTDDTAAMSWVAYCFFAGTVGYTRMTVRKAYNVWGSLPEDLLLGFTMYPFVLCQTSLMTENKGEGAPGYCDEILKTIEMSSGGRTAAPALKTEETASA